MHGDLVKFGGGDDDSASSTLTKKTIMKNESDDDKQLNSALNRNPYSDFLRNKNNTSSNNNNRTFSEDEDYYDDLNYLTNKKNSLLRNKNEQLILPCDLKNHNRKNRKAVSEEALIMSEQQQKLEKKSDNENLREKSHNKNNIIAAAQLIGNKNNKITEIRQIKSILTNSNNNNNKKKNFFNNLNMFQACNNIYNNTTREACSINRIYNNNNNNSTNSSQKLLRKYKYYYSNYKYNNIKTFNNKSNHNNSNHRVTFSSQSNDELNSLIINEKDNEDEESEVSKVAIDLDKIKKKNRFLTFYIESPLSEILGHDGNNQELYSSLLRHLSRKGRNYRIKMNILSDLAKSDSKLAKILKNLNKDLGDGTVHRPVNEEKGDHYLLYDSIHCNNLFDKQKRKSFINIINKKNKNKLATATTALTSPSRHTQEGIYAKYFKKRSKADISACNHKNSNQNNNKNDDNKILNIYEEREEDVIVAVDDYDYPNHNHNNNKKNEINNYEYYYIETAEIDEEEKIDVDEGRKKKDVTKDDEENNSSNQSFIATNCQVKTKTRNISEKINEKIKKNYINSGEFTYNNNKNASGENSNDSFNNISNIKLAPIRKENQFNKKSKVPTSETSNENFAAEASNLPIENHQNITEVSLSADSEDDTVTSLKKSKNNAHRYRNVNLLRERTMPNFDRTNSLEINRQKYGNADSSSNRQLHWVNIATMDGMHNIKSKNDASKPIYNANASWFTAAKNDSNNINLNSKSLVFLTSLSASHNNVPVLSSEKTDLVQLTQPMRIRNSDKNEAVENISLNRPSYTAHTKRIRAEREKALTAGMSNARESRSETPPHDDRSGEASHTTKATQITEINANHVNKGIESEEVSSKRKDKLPILIASKEETKDKKSSFDLKRLLELTSPTVNVDNSQRKAGSSGNASSSNREIKETKGIKVQSNANSSPNLTSNSYLLNQAVIYKKIADYNQEKSTRFIKISSSKNLIKAKSDSASPPPDLRETLIIKTPPITFDRQRTQVQTPLPPKQATPEQSELKQPPALQLTPTHNKLSRSKHQVEHQPPAASAKERLLTKQATLANEFNQKIKLTNKKLDDLSKKLIIYRAAQTKSSRPVRSDEPYKKVNIDMGEENSRNLQPRLEKSKTKSDFSLQRISNNPATSKGEKIVDNNGENYENLGDQDFEDKEVEEMLNEQVKSEPIQIKKRVKEEFGNVKKLDKKQLILNGTKIAYFELVYNGVKDLIEIGEPALPKSQRHYNYVATSTSLLNKADLATLSASSLLSKNQIEKKEPLKSNSNKTCMAAEDCCEKGADEGDESASSIFTNFEGAVLTTNNLGSKRNRLVLDFARCEQEVLKLQRRVLMQLQQAIEAYKLDNTSVELPSNSASLLHNIYNSYNSKRSKLDVYKFYERSKTSPVNMANSLRAKTSTTATAANNTNFLNYCYNSYF